MCSMASGNTIAEVAGLIGDPARANMLSALMGGQALTAGELARVARITAQTASGHLAKMLAAGLLAVERQGRHRYYRLASPDVAEAMQALMALAAGAPRRHHPVGPRDVALRRARTCYDHMAGRLAIALSDALVARGYVVMADGAALVTDAGRDAFQRFGLDLKDTPATRRPLCRTCLDWSERRPHLAGRLGAGLLARSVALGWVAPVPHSRALTVTPAGEDGLHHAFGLPADWRREEAG
ncbi:MAG: transcriptional regulator [Rhizobiales bacterium 35-68-8]|nr:MAG: transcriptional regulator [Rhizobiales bacterium 35-68-8]